MKNGYYKFRACFNTINLVIVFRYICQTKKNIWAEFLNWMLFNSMHRNWPLTVSYSNIIHSLSFVNYDKLKWPLDSHRYEFSIQIQYFFFGGINISLKCGASSLFIRNQYWICLDVAWFSFQTKSNWFFSHINACMKEHIA